MWPRPPMPTTATFLPGPAPQCLQRASRVVMPAHSSGAATSSSMPSGMPSDEVLVDDDLLAVAADGRLAVVARAVVGRRRRPWCSTAPRRPCSSRTRRRSRPCSRRRRGRRPGSCVTRSRRSRRRRRSRGRAPSGRWPGPTPRGPGGCRCGRCRRTRCRSRRRRRAGRGARSVPGSRAAPAEAAISAWVVLMEVLLVIADVRAVHGPRAPAAPIFRAPGHLPRRGRCLVRGG